MDIVKGQRWISLMEPELGLGIIEDVGNSRITIYFDTSRVKRVYSKTSAPIKRVIFNPGDRLKDLEGNEFIILDCRDNEGLYTYFGEKYYIKEEDISDLITGNNPANRIKKDDYDSIKLFDLRYETIKLYHDILKNEFRGFYGGRINLIPHQFYIADNIIKRHVVRVLLSDEVGLGKTIESLLIIHRMILTGRISRVLIIVPDHLVYQWFSELIHKFNLGFRIIDEEYYKTFKDKHETNPFVDYQFYIAGVNFLTGSKNIEEDAVNCDWDIIIVDEAHHLKEDSCGYNLVYNMSKKVKNIILLTATPEQFGEKSHFARLRLLDPYRFTDYDDFLKDANFYKDIAVIADKIINNSPLNNNDVKLLNQKPDSNYTISSLAALDKEDKNKIINKLIDMHGISRIMFRNRRDVIGRFSKRTVYLTALDLGMNKLTKINNEYLSDITGEMKIKFYDYQNDARIAWIKDFLKDHKDEKVLLISSRKEKAEAIEKALNNKKEFKTALFHEGMDIIERDKKAFWFDSSSGAQILICSEIGSEGRNFQFVNNLILFDLPLNPELLEQRIGRLDRIGQINKINIYVPFIKNTHGEILARWFNEGINGFNQNINGGEIIYEKFNKKIIDILNEDNQYNIESVNEVIKKTKNFYNDLLIKLKDGRDKLLELNSFSSIRAKKIIKQINDIGFIKKIERVLEKIFNYYGINMTEIDEDVFVLKGKGAKTDAFPNIENTNTVVTFNRDTAMARKSMIFLTADHPIVQRALDLIISGESGNCSIGFWHDKFNKDFYLEAIYVLESVSPAFLNIGRFLPPTPIRVLVNSTLEDYSAKYSHDKISNLIRDLKIKNVVSNNINLKLMFLKSEEAAIKNAEVIKDEIVVRMKNELMSEYERLKELKNINKNIDDEELKLSLDEISTLEEYINNARVRLDSVRLIVRGVFDN